jgi:MFS family permease
MLFHENKTLKILLLFNGVFVFASSLLGPLYAVFVETIDGNIISISLAWSIFMLSATFFMFLVRKYGDQVKEKEYLLMGGYLVRALVWFAYPFVPSLGILLLLQILLGLGEALGTPAYDAIFAKHLDKNRSVEEYTDRKLIVNLCSAIAIIVGGIIVAEVGFTVLFFIMGSLALISFVGILIQPRKLI